MKVIEDYIEVGLQIGRHIPGFVDAYYGPAGLRERAEEGPVPEPATLAQAAETLIQRLTDADGFEPSRRHWLEAQLRAIATVARKLAGEQISYVDEVERCYGVRPLRVAEEQFAEAHEKLEQLLPGPGSLSDRYQAWLDAKAIPGERLLPVVESVTADLRSRTDDLFGLPPGEEVELGLVTSEPWSAFNYYLGGLRSRVVVNTDLPNYSTVLADLIAHELYPGHHTEHATKEQMLVRDRGYLEESILLVATPACVVSEGIAGIGEGVLLGEEPEEVAAEHLKRFGIELDAEEAAAVRRAREVLQAVQVNAALLVHEEGARKEEARDYLMTWGLVARPRAEKQLEFITDPVWRSYITTYTSGLRLCRSFVAGDPDRFRRLLTEQLTPTDLEKGAGE